MSSNYFKYLLVGLAVIAALVFFFRKEDTWQGIYYPGGNTSAEVYSPIFKTYAECQAWTIQKAVNDGDDYECGKNCQVESEVIPGEYLQVCEETL